MEIETKLEETKQALAESRAANRDAWKEGKDVNDSVVYLANQIGKLGLLWAQDIKKNKSVLQSNQHVKKRVEKTQDTLQRLGNEQKVQLQKFAAAAVASNQIRTHPEKEVSIFV